MRVTRREVRVERVGAHAVRAGVDVHELRLGAGLADGFARRDERVRHRDNGISVADARGHQRETHGIGAIGNAHAVAAAAVLRKLALEGVHLGATDESR